MLYIDLSGWYGSSAAGGLERLGADGVGEVDECLAVDGAAVDDALEEYVAVDGAAVAEGASGVGGAAGSGVGGAAGSGDDPFSLDGTETAPSISCVLCETRRRFSAEHSDDFMGLSLGESCWLLSRLLSSFPTEPTLSGERGSGEKDERGGN